MKRKILVFLLVVLFLITSSLIYLVFNTCYEPTVYGFGDKVVFENGVVFEGLPVAGQAFSVDVDRQRGVTRLKTDWLYGKFFAPNSELIMSLTEGAVWDRSDPFKLTFYPLGIYNQDLVVEYGVYQIPYVGYRVGRQTISFKYCLLTKLWGYILR